METVIRSPQNGVIKRLAHKEGVSPFSYPRVAARKPSNDIARYLAANNFIRTNARQGRYW